MPRLQSYGATERTAIIDTDGWKSGPSHLVDRNGNFVGAATAPLTVNFPTALVDSFGRLRVSSPVTLIDSQQQYDKQDLLWVEKFVGTASRVHLPNESSATLSIGTAAGDRAVVQLREYLRYQPAKSQFVFCTGAFGAQQSGTEKLIGYGDDNNGVFFGQDGGGVFVLLRSSSSGSVDDSRKVYQADWNLDKLDGTGPSGLTLSGDLQQIFFMDVEWLGSGAVSLGFAIGRTLLYVHEFQNANAFSGAYMTTANLPVRYELKNTEAVASASSLKQTCSSVISEGGQQSSVAYPFSVVRANVSVPVGDLSTATIIFAARHPATFNGIENRVKFAPLDYKALATGNGRLVTQPLYNISLTGAPTWNVPHAESAMEGSIDIGTGFTGGIPVGGDVVAGGGGNKTGAGGGGAITGKLPFGLDVDAANPIIIGLAAWSLGSTMTGDFVLNWEEQR